MSLLDEKKKKKIYMYAFFLRGMGDFFTVHKNWHNKYICLQANPLPAAIKRPIMWAIPPSVAYLVFDQYTN